MSLLLAGFLLFDSTNIYRIGLVLFGFWAISSCSSSAKTWTVFSASFLLIACSAYGFARLGAFCFPSVFGAQAISLFDTVTSSVLPSGMNFFCVFRLRCLLSPPFLEEVRLFPFLLPFSENIVLSS